MYSSIREVTNTMADTGSTESAAKKKFRLRKPDTRDRTEEKMIKYYSDPEKQQRLQERLQIYKSGIIDLQHKIKELEKYVRPELLGNERTENP